MQYDTEFFRKQGAKGNKKARERHSIEEFKKWGKKGGRPKKKVPPTNS